MKDIFLLDLDETLLDFPKAEQANFCHTMHAFSLSPSADDYARFHAINEGLWKALERGEITLPRLKEKRFELLFEERGFAGDTVEIARAYTENFLLFCFPYEGAVEFTATLSRMGRVYLVTNGSPEIQHRHVHDAGLSPYFDGLFISGEVGASKPSKAFASAVEGGIPSFCRERTVWIGDSLTSDGQCAKLLGVDFILFGEKRDFGGMQASTYDEALACIRHLG